MDAAGRDRRPCIRHPGGGCITYGVIEMDADGKVLSLENHNPKSDLAGRPVFL